MDRCSDDVGGDDACFELILAGMIGIAVVDSSRTPLSRSIICALGGTSFPLRAPFLRLLPSLLSLSLFFRFDSFEGQAPCMNHDERTLVG